VLFAALSLNSIVAQSASAPAFSWAYPNPATSVPLAYPNPSVSPTPSILPPPKPSEAAQKALEYIAKRDGIPVEALIIEADHPTEYPSLGRKFQVVTLIDNRPNGQIYKLLMDLADGRIEENISALLDAEAQAYQLKYGKLDTALYQRLQELGNNDTLTVAIWMASQPHKTQADLQQAAFATLAVKYPEAQAAMQRSGKPMDVDDPELARKIEADYMVLIGDEMKTRTLPLVTELQQRKFAVTTYEGMPSFTAVLPKRVILELSKREDVSGLYLAEGQEKPALDSAVPSMLAPIVWARGYQGSGVTIAILEHGNVDPLNGYLNLSPIIRTANNGVQNHTTHVAGDAASFNSTYKGVAPQATILRTGEDGSEGDVVTALQWAIDIQTAPIVNYSGGFTADANVNWIDKAFDYWARNNFKTIVVAAGNSGGYISSPGKGWNVLTIGNTEDQNNTNWADDIMRISSAYINPVSAHNDREKPEVVTVGTNVKAIVNNSPLEMSGTSMAAPQVAGLAALLINRNSSLNIWPEAQRAIIMASTNHNIEGPSIIVRGQGDLKDGAGAINADLADQAAQVRGAASTPCSSSCWWGDSIPNSSFPVGTEITRTFNVTTTTLIRVAIAWWAHADTPANNYSFSRLDTDLDLRIKRPDGQQVAVSVSFDNNYEIVEFMADQSGQYQIVITKYRGDEPSNYMGTALVMIPQLTHKIYIPLIIR